MDALVELVNVVNAEVVLVEDAVGRVSAALARTGHGQSASGSAAIISITSFSSLDNSVSASLSGLSRGDDDDDRVNLVKTVLSVDDISSERSGSLDISDVISSSKSNRSRDSSNSVGSSASISGSPLHDIVVKEAPRVTDAVGDEDGLEGVELVVVFRVVSNSIPSGNEHVSSVERRRNLSAD